MTVLIAVWIGAAFFLAALAALTGKTALWRIATGAALVAVVLATFHLVAVLT